MRYSDKRRSQGYGSGDEQRMPTQPPAYGNSARGYGEAPVTGGGYYQSMPSGREQVEQVLDMLYRRKWTALIIFLLVLGGAVGYAYMLPDEYESYSFVMLELEGNRNRGAETTNPTPENLFARNDRTLQGELQILMLSDDLPRRVYQRLQEEASRDSLATPTMPQGYVRYAPSGQGGNQVIQIIGVSPNPQDAARLSNLYADEYVKMTQEASRTHLTATRVLLADQEARRGEELRMAEEAMQNYRRTQGSINLDQGGANLATQIGMLEAQRDDALIELEMRRNTLITLEREVAQINPQLVQRITSSDKQQIDALQDRIAEKEEERGLVIANNPNLMQSERLRGQLAGLNKEINDLREQLRTVAQQYIEDVTAVGGLSTGEEALSYIAQQRQQIIDERIAISGLEARIDVLNRRLGVYQREFNALPTQTLELARLERARQRAEETYQLVSDRLQQAVIAEESEPGYAFIIRQAVAPLDPVRPDRQQYLILGAFFALLLGLGLAIVRDKLDSRIYKPDALRALGYKVLGIIPDHKKLLKAEFKDQPVIEQDGLRLQTNLLTLLAPLSPVAEAYRHLRNEVQFSRPDKVVQTILVTSPSVEEGKSTTAANLAVAMAEAGRRTVLVDADLRRPRQHEQFGLDLGPGLVQYLCKEPRFDPASVKTGIDNLHVMPAGRVVSRSAQLLATRRMREFLAELQRQFDVVIIDTPPLRVASDASLLATQCDATILVTRAGQTKEAELTMGVETLQNLGAPVTGILFNGFDVSMAIGHKYRYRDYARYAQYSKEGYYGYDYLDRTVQESSRA